MMDGRNAPGRDDEGGDGTEDGARLRLDRPGLSIRFARRRVLLAAGEELPYDARDWADALVEVRRGTLELVCASGRRERLAEGSILWLDGVPLRSVRNPGPGPAELLAVSRSIGPSGACPDPDDDDAPDPPTPDRRPLDP